MNVYSETAHYKHRIPRARVLMTCN